MANNSNFYCFKYNGGSLMQFRGHVGRLSSGRQKSEQRSNLFCLSTWLYTVR